MQKEFLSFLSDPSHYPGNQTIWVIESSKPSLLDEFPFKTDRVNMLGQEARCYSDLLFEEVDEDFSLTLEIKDVVMLIWDASDKKIIYSKGENYTQKTPILDIQRKYRILHVGAV